MGHDVLEGNIIVKSQSSPRAAKGVEPMPRQGDGQGMEDSFKCFSDMSMNNLAERRIYVGK